MVLKDAVWQGERDAMIAPLVAHNTAQGVDFTNSPFALALEDDGGNVVGGITGYFRWGWLYLASVAVPAESRGQGWGRLLMEMAETAAVKRAAGTFGWIPTASRQDHSTRNSAIGSSDNCLTTRPVIHGSLCSRGCPLMQPNASLKPSVAAAPANSIRFGSSFLNNPE